MEPSANKPTPSSEPPALGANDEARISQLLEDHSSWIRRRVRARLGQHLRARFQSGDIEQEALLRFVKYGPKLPPLNDQQFRHLMARIVENVIRDQNDWLHAVARDPRREVRGSQIEFALAAKDDDGASPSTHAMRNEHENLVHFCLGLLNAEDRQVIILRRVEGLSFEDVAKKLEIKTPAADARFRRAMRRFSTLVRRIQQGEWDVFEDEESAGENPATSS